MSAKSKKKAKSWLVRFLNVIKKPFIKINQKMSFYMSRRPHRSFRRTRRRDYARELKLPGCIRFTKLVFDTIWGDRKIFLLLSIFYAIFTALMVGLASQDTYQSIVDTLSATSGDSLNGFWGQIGQAGLLFISTATGGLSGSLSEGQQIFSGIIILMAWLTSVWLLRNILAGHKPKLRDGLYNAGSPILPTFLVALILIIQLIPASLAMIGYGAASATGLLNGGVEAMLFWFAAALLVLMSLYFITSTIFALIIVTLPGMYPFRAIKIAGDLVLGRRIRVLLRVLWLILLTILIWVVVMVPVIMLDSWIKNIWPLIDWLPIVPVFLLALGSLTVVWVSSYMYLLYRKVVDNESDKN
jgi:hypothetical protein